MSTVAGATPAPRSFALWERQAGAIFAYELRKSFVAPRALLVYLLAGAPVALFLLVALLAGSPLDLSSIPSTYTNTYFFLVRMVVYFGCAWTFTSLFRGEVFDRSLHYYFLAPVRREVIVAGKFLSALVGSTLLFGATTFLTFAALHLGHPWRVVVARVFTGAGFELLLACLNTTTFACLGYGSLFLVAGLLFRNPFGPAVLFWGWEWLNYLLPPSLKLASIVFYLQSLAPLPFDEGMFALLAEPVRPAYAMIGLSVVSALLLGVAIVLVRRMEVSYAKE